MEQRVDDVTSHDSDATIPTGAPPAKTRNDDDVMDASAEACRLKHQKSGYISHLARLYKEADVLILERCTVNDVTSILNRASFSRLDEKSMTARLLYSSDEDNNWLIPQIPRPNDKLFLLNFKYTTCICLELIHLSMLLSECLLRIYIVPH